LAVVFAVVFQFLYKWILNKIPKQKGLASFITTLIVVLCTLLPISLLGVKLISESKQLYVSISESNTEGNIFGLPRNVASELQSSFPHLKNFSVDINTYLRQGLKWAVEHLDVLFSSVAKILMGLFIFTISLYYMFKDGHKLKNFVVFLSPLNDADDEVIFGKLKRAVNSVVKGNLAIALIQGVLSAVGLSIFGIPNPIIWGTIAGVCALVPSVGTSIVLVPSIIYLFLFNHLGSAFGLLIWGGLAVGLIDNLLGPRLIGKDIPVHPLIILFSVLGGLAFWGPIGFILGPLIVSFLFALVDIYAISLRRADPEH
jgi:predicted PurR-regulated permease PerM